MPIAVPERRLSLSNPHAGANERATLDSLYRTTPPPYHATLCCAPRRRERRPDLVQYVRGLGRYANVVDMSKEEREGRYFEGTGSLVLDRPGRVAYVALSGAAGACLVAPASPCAWPCLVRHDMRPRSSASLCGAGCPAERSDAALAAKWADRMGYDLVTFHSTNRGSPVYHTNVMMAVGTGVAVVCLESVADPAERAALHASLSRRHEVVDITAAQMEALVSHAGGWKSVASSDSAESHLPELAVTEHLGGPFAGHDDCTAFATRTRTPAFVLPQCGNGLEVRNRWNLPVMAMSTRSYNAFTPEQREAILRHVAAIHHAPIDTLEELGGGGVRCTLAELFP